MCMYYCISYYMFNYIYIYNRMNSYICNILLYDYEYYVLRMHGK